MKTFSDLVQAPELLLPHILYLCYGCTLYTSTKQQAEAKADSKFCQIFFPVHWRMRKLGLALGEKNIY